MFKKIKKFLSMMLVLALILSMTACGTEKAEDGAEQVEQAEGDPSSEGPGQLRT